VSISNANSKTLQALDNTVNDRGTRYLGYALVLLFLMAFTTWGYYAPLKSAAIASGTVSIAGNKKTVQHVDGGIITSIHVEDGDKVATGQIILSLDNSTASNEFLRLKKQTVQLVAELIRWRAEQADQSRIDLASWQKEFSNATNSTQTLDSCAADQPEQLICRIELEAINNAIEEQQNILNARLALYKNSIISMNYQVDASASKEQEQQNARTGIQRKLRLIGAELKRYRDLEKQGLITRQEVFELESDLADIRRLSNETKAAINFANDQRLRLQSDLLVLQNTQNKTTNENIAKVSNQLDEAVSEILKADSTLLGTQIRSPIDGVVIGTKVNTIGGVILPGETLMEIVPSNATLLIESRVNPIDRDSISVGQVAQVRFSAFDRRASKPVPGKVALISADRLIDPNTNTAFYKTLVELTTDPSEALDGAEIYPGMQADVLIETGEQTFIEYLLSPVSRSFRHALTES